jgi:PTS system nitrogen regulatory IIA component
MPWTDLLVADRIIVLVEPVSRDPVLDAAAQLLGNRLPDATQAIASGLREREALGSTGIGRGVAIPHARGPMFRQPRGAFLRLTRPVDFAAPDGRPVDLVFAMCAPDDLPEVHLQHLAGIAERFADPDFLDSLRKADDLATLRQALLGQGAAGSHAA